MVAGWLDGQRGEVFVAAFDAPGGGFARCVHTAPRAQGRAARGPRRLLRAASRAVISSSSATTTTVDRCVESRPSGCRDRGSADFAGRVGSTHRGLAPRARSSPHALTPVYVRRPDVVLARERATASETAAPALHHPAGRRSRRPRRRRRAPAPDLHESVGRRGDSMGAREHGRGTSLRDARPGRHVSSPTARAGWCSTSCTSTAWPSMSTSATKVWPGGCSSTCWPRPPTRGRTPRRSRSVARTGRPRALRGPWLRRRGCSARLLPGSARRRRHSVEARA